MTINQAIRILDPATTAEELATIEYYGGLHGREKMVAACDEACRHDFLFHFCSSMYFLII